MSCRNACRPVSTATGCPTWPERFWSGSAPQGYDGAVFVWQWVQQHRLLFVLVLALVIVSSAGGTAWALVFRTVSSPVGLREALRIYRREQTGKVIATLRNRLPAPGVYTYRTSGGEGLSLMGVQRAFPSSSSMIVADGRCATLSWVPITQHTESTTVCAGPDGSLSVPRLVTDESIVGTTTTSTVRCPATAYLLPPRTRPRRPLGGDVLVDGPGGEGGAGRCGARAGHGGGRRP